MRANLRARPPVRRSNPARSCRRIRRCAQALLPIVRKPSALPLNEYQAKLADYLRNFCHRDEKAGWKVDKRVRDTGPWIGTYANGHWAGNYFGTHAPALIWYSPDMYAWLKVNRPSEGAQPPGEAQPVPDGAIMVKEMYPAPAAGLRPRRSAPPARRQRGRRHHGARQRRLPRRLVLGLVRMGRRLAAGLAAAGAEATTIRSWASASTAPTATPRRRTTTPSRRSRTSRASAASRWSSSARTSSSIRHGRACRSRIAQAEAKAAPQARRRPLQPGLHQDVLLAAGGRAGSRADRQDALGDLRPCLGEAGAADARPASS